METLAGVDRLLMCGTRATLLLAPGADLAEDDARKAFESKGLKFEGLATETIERPAAAYVARTPKFT
ncbi:MAG: hypothetical protein AB7O97_03355 [Planctomycetota bacterium]